MKTRTTHHYLLPALAAVAFALSAAAPASAAEPHHTIVRADAVKWGPAPPSLPSGAKAVVLAGNPGAAGPFTLRLKLPVGYTIPPHRHSSDERVTVISGAVNIGAGEKLDRAAAARLPQGDFVNLPAGMAHYAFVAAETIIQVSANGPFDVIYVNAADDPRRQ